MIWIALIALAAVAVFATLYAQSLQSKTVAPSSNSQAKTPTTDIPYRLRSGLFTPAERKFYEALSAAVTPEQIVFGKVRVADILQPTSGISRTQWQGAFNRISSKHFDYVICDRPTLSVQSVVELQDKSHSKSDRVKRDQFLRKACKSAGLALIEFKVKADYSTADIRAAL